MTSLHFSISVIIPTLNSAKTLRVCLDSIALQNYPRRSMEVIFSDGGSQDETLGIIDLFKASCPEIVVKVVANSLRTGEAGKAEGLKVATHEIVAFVDSDNILEGKDWFAKMTQPFGCPDIIATEPLRYTYRQEDGPITRYCALMGMNDPLCYFLGNYDRECVLSGTWTSMPYAIIDDKGSFLKLKLNPRRLPTIGANGFLIRRKELEALAIGDYLFDIDLLTQILTENPDKCVAKVRIGVTHIYTGSLRGFLNKQKRRILDYKHYNKLGIRSYPWEGLQIAGFLYFCASSLLVLPLLIQTGRGYARRRDNAWLLHPVLCIMTFWIYGLTFLFGRGVGCRKNWQTR